MERNRPVRVATALLGVVVAVGLGLLGGGTASIVARPAPAQAASSIGGYITRSEMLSRAQYWVDQNVVYGTAFNPDGSVKSTRTAPDPAGTPYRTDCSGYLAMAWHMNTPAPVASDFDNYGTKIADPDDMQPGDAIQFSGHIEMFAKWRSSDHTQGAFTYSLNGPIDQDWAKGPVANSHGQVGTASWSEIQGNTRLRYDKVSDSTGSANIYGVLSDGRLTFTSVDAASGVRTHGAVVSTTRLPFTPKAMATLNFNTILVASTDGNLYRIDVITNNLGLAYNVVDLGISGWYLNLLAYDGHGHLYGIDRNATLHRYAIGATKPTDATITDYTVIQSGWNLLTLTATGPDWLLGTVANGELRTYHVVGAGNVAARTLKETTWQVFDSLMSPGGGVYLAHRPEGSMFRYLDANPYDLSGSDLTSKGVVDATGWTQVLMSAQPDTVT